MQVFFSYAHQDEKLAQQFMSHLAYLKHQKDAQFWYDGKIRAGDMRKPIITSMLESADLILLFITPDFVSSTDCYELEMKQALERHNTGKAHIVPIIVRPVVWDKTPFGELQVVPKNGKPITTWGNRDTAWVTVVEQIHELMQEVTVDNEKRHEFEAEKSGLTFARIAIGQQSRGWCELEMPIQNSLYKKDPYQSFYLCGSTDLSDPGFDITLLNTSSKPIILTKVGIEITSVSHPVTLSIMPRASKIEVDTSYTIDLPDILAQFGPFDDALSYLHKIVSMDIADPIYMQAKAPYRYCLVLHKYCQYMPQEADIHMLIQTNTEIEKSLPIHLSLLWGNHGNG